MRRVVVAIALLVVFVLAGWILSVTFDDDAAVAPPPPPDVASPQKPPKPPRRAEAPAAEPPVRTLLRNLAAAPPSPPSPANRGRLEIDVTPRRIEGGSIRLTALLPTGASLGTLTADESGKCRFEGLPHEVPLVVRVEAPGFLTGYCCDVVLPATSQRRKSIELAPAPVVAIHAVELPKRRDLRAARVELWRGDDVVASGTTDDDGLVSLAPQVLGRMRVRVEADGLAASGDVAIDVWPSQEQIERDIELAAGGSVEVAVLTSSGAPAPGVGVWLVGEANSPPSAATDKSGIAVFSGLRAGLVLWAIARAGDGSVASVQLTTNPGAPQRVALLLGKPGPLVGDVVDQGGGAIAGATVEVSVRPFGDPVTVRSDDTGRFETPALPSGLAEVTVRREGFVEWRAPGVVVIDPAVGGKVRARLTRLPVGRAYVTVKDDSCHPLEGAVVNLRPAGRAERTAADGTCRFENLPAGVEQDVLVRLRGFRMRAPTLDHPAVVRPRANVAESAEVVLAAVADPPAEPGPCSIRGVLLRPGGRPVQGALVEAGPWCTGSAADGSFVLEGLKPTTAGEPLEFRVSGVPWPLERVRFLVDVESAGVLDFGTVMLATRPYAQIDVPASRTRKGDAAVNAFWLSTNHADTFLGRATGRFEPVSCVSYDGRWMHLPPADDWRADGRGEVFVAFPTPRGLVTATASWTLRPNAADLLRPAPRSRPGRLDVSAVAGDRGAPLVFRQVACDTMFDPRSIHVPTGDEQAPIDPFASLASLRTFELARGAKWWTLDELAPGRWRVECGRASGEANVPEEESVRLVR